MTTMTIPVKPGTNEWLEARQKGLGASDAAAALGIDEFRTSRKLWEEKQGHITVEETEAMFWGKRLEDTIGRVAAERRGWQIRTPSVMHADSNHPWMMATIDRLILNTDELLEVKNTGYWVGQQFGADGTDDVPFPYLCQVQHQLHVTGRKVANLAALIGGNNLRIFRIPRDEDVIKQVVEQEEEWWETHMVNDTPPAVVSDDEQLMRALHANAQAGLDRAPMEAEEEVIGWLMNAIRLGARADDEIKLRKAQLMEMMGSTQTLMLAGDEGLKISWKNNKDSVKVDWETVARALAGDPHIIGAIGLDGLVDHHTTTKPGPRVFRTPAAWKQD